MKRILCVKIEEDCPINDIIYNNQSKYTNNSITYNTIKINEKEFLHYTNEQINNFIITNLTVIGKYGGGYPYGSDDNNETEYFSPMDKIPYSKGYPKEFKYYFYKYLSSVDLSSFFLENNLSEIYKFYFEKLSDLDRMTLFSTGYFSLSENDIKNLEDLSGLNRNNHYSKITSKQSLSGYIAFIIFGPLMFIGAYVCLYFSMEDNYKPLMIFQSILFIYLAILILIDIVEIIYKNKIFELSENIPRYLFDDIEAIKETNALKRIWAFLGIFAIQIPFFILNICRIKEERKKFNVAQKKMQEETLNFDETDNMPEDFKAIKASGIDIELYKKA